MTLLCLETPENIEELQAMLRHYQDKNVRIRVVGAQHSCEDATHGRAFGERDIVAISMTNFDTISIVDDRRRLKKDPYALVRIEAGVHIAESPYIHPVPKPEAQLYRWLEQHGLALPVVGGVAHQTVVGFLATGSGGGSQTHCIHDTLVAVELVDGHGERKEFRRDRDPEFAAAGVSLGLLGVVVSVTLKLGPRFQVYGKEVFARWTAQDPAQDTHDFLNKHEYARMIWWPQTKVVQRWSCERVIAREDFHANPYVPVGLKPFERQVVTNVLLTLSGNLESIGDLRGVANKLRASRVIEYLGLVDVHERIRPVAARETTVEVLQRPTHFHWTRSRFRPRRRSDLTPRSAPDLGQTVKVVRELALASERLLARAVLAAGDEIMKRLFYNSQGHEIVDPTKRRQVLDTYGDFFSNLFATDRDVGPIRAERVATQVEKWGQQLFGSDVKLSPAEVADYFGEWVAAQLVPIEDERPDDRWSKLLLAIVRRVVYTQMPAILSNFFAAFTDTTTGFCDWDFNGLAVDRAINHHLVQTKFSELWVRGKHADEAIARLHRHLSPNDQQPAMDDKFTSFRWLQAYLAHASEPWVQWSAIEGDEPIAGTAQALDDWQPPPGEVDPVELFRRRGAYSMELYAGKASNDFYLYPGSSDDKTPWVRLNFFWWAYNAGTQRDFFKGLWECLEGLDYRCHWGKELPVTDGTLPWDAEYRAKVQAFVEVRKQLDPNELFYTNHWKKILEPLVLPD